MKAASIGDARDLLLKDERELVDKVKSVAAKRRNLHSGGQLKQDYVFQWANDGKSREECEIFRANLRTKNTLLLYSFSTVPNWDNPCLPARRLVDGFDRSFLSGHSPRPFVALAKLRPIDNAWAKKRGWVADRAGIRIGFFLSSRLQMPERLR